VALTELRKVQNVVAYMTEQPIRVTIECLTPNPKPDEGIEE
jgi:hypothetical protein